MAERTGERKTRAKKYKKPVLTRVKLSREMAVLTNCKDWFMSPTSDFSCADGGCYEDPGS